MRSLCYSALKRSVAVVGILCIVACVTAQEQPTTFVDDFINITDTAAAQPPARVEKGFIETNWTITGVSRYVIQFGESIRKSKGFDFTFEDGTAVTIPVYEMERIVREYGAAHQAIPQTIYGGNLIVSPAAGAK